MTTTRLTQSALDRPDRTDEFQSEVIASAVPFQIVEFAEHVPGADIALLQDAIIASGSDLARFAERVPGADVSALRDAALATGDDGEVIGFIGLDGSDDRALVEHIVRGRGGDVTAISARMDEVSPTQALGEFALSTGDVGFMINTLYLDDVDTRAIEDAVIASGDGRAAIAVIQSRSAHDIGALQQVIEDSRDVRTMMFAAVILNDLLDLDSLAGAVARCGDAESGAESDADLVRLCDAFEMVTGANAA